MKKVLTALLGCFIAFAAFAGDNDPKPKAETATIYIYRTGQFAGAGNNWAMFLDGEKICKLSNNRFIKVEVPAGKHRISSKIGGIEVMKKETEVEIEAEPGNTYYVACNMKQSVMRARLEMIEVTKSTGEKQLKGMTIDKCQDVDDDKEAKK
jgi:hypothetical protein